MSRLVDLLKGHRKRAGLSQNALAKRIGYDAAYINMIEASKRPMSQPVAEGVIRALNLDVDDAAELLAEAGYWPWPDVSFRDALAMLAGGAPKETEAA